MEKVQLCHIIYNTIKNNPNITSNQIIWLLAKLGESNESITQSLDMLIYRNSEIPRCVNYFFIPKEKNRKGIAIAHYRCSTKMSQLSEKFFENYKAENKYDLPCPSFSLKKEKNDLILKENGASSTICTN